MRTPLFRSPGLWMIVLLAVAGCRSYGAYDNEEKTEAAIQEANEQFAAELATTRQSLELLRTTTAQRPDLAPFAQQFESIVLLHETLLHEHEELAAQREEGEWYRSANRAYGTVVVEQDIIRRRYEALFAGMGTVADTLANTPRQLAFPEESRYFVAPPHYRRVANTGLLPAPPPEQNLPGAAAAVPDSSAVGSTPADTAGQGTGIESVAPQQ
jgi:hypothetical protein